MSNRTDPIFQGSYDDDDSVFSPNDRIDYGTCDLTNPEIDSSYLNELSSPRMLYSLLLTPQIEEIASIITNKVISRGREEARRIETAGTLEQLVDLMNHRPDPLNHNLIVSRVLSFGTKAAEHILNAFQKPVNATFLELGIRIIYKCGLDYNEKLIRLIHNGPRRAYMISLLCMLLGFSGKLEHTKPLWDYYKFLKEQFPTETYSDGPLLGLLEIKARFLPNLNIHVTGNA